MMAMTTNSSISVKARGLLGVIMDSVERQRGPSRRGIIADPQDGGRHAALRSANGRIEG